MRKMYAKKLFTGGDRRKEQCVFCLQAPLREQSERETGKCEEGEKRRDTSYLAAEFVVWVGRLLVTSLKPYLLDNVSWFPNPVSGKAMSEKIRSFC